MFSRQRIAAALLIGAVGCLFIWVAAPYNNFLLKNSFISDTYLPVAAVVFTLVLVLGVNPLLCLVRRSWMIDRRQLALVFAMLLTAAVVPSQGLMRMLPWSLASTTQRINNTRPLAEAVERSGVPPVLFPDEIGYEKPTPTSDQLLNELDPGSAIPWGDWLMPGLTWGVFLLACWLMMVGVGLVMFPEWRHKERLQFPLLDVYRSLMPEAGAGRVLPDIFRNRLFWIGAGSVMAIYALNGLSHHTHGSFPGFPTGWRLSPVLTESPWRYLPSSITDVGHIYFVLVGMAFFMPNRVGFSIWFVTVAYAFYEMFGRAYLQPYEGGYVNDHRTGAMIAVSVTVLYLSRHHWRHVGGVMGRRVASDADRMLRASGWMVVTGALGMLAWLVWAGVPVVWAAVFVLIGFMVSLLIARIVAETGLPFFRITGMNPGYFLAMLPAGWLNGATVYMAGFVTMIFQVGSRVSAAVMASHAAGIDEKATPKHQLRLGYLMIGILVVGFAAAGSVHLYMGYTQPETMDGTYSPLNTWGANRMRGPERDLLRWSRDAWAMPSGRLEHLAVGIVGVAGLQIACMVSPAWPLHPIGFLMVGHYYGRMAWASVLIGWLLKITIIYCGGSSAFRRARPLFLGLILGEIFSAVIWTLVPVILLWLGTDPARVGHIPLLPR